MSRRTRVFIQDRQWQTALQAFAADTPLHAATLRSRRPYVYNDRIMQVAAFVNSITHLLAGKKELWGTLDALHATLQQRLARSLVTHDHLSNQLADDVFAHLLTASATTSESARRYYLRRASLHRAPANCDLLYTAAAAAHCAGGCSARDARQMRLAALPHNDASSFGSFREPVHSRTLATMVTCSRAAPGTGVIGCACRVMLCSTLQGGTRWPRGLCSGPSEYAVDLAFSSRASRAFRYRRCVTAQVAGNRSIRRAPRSGVSIDVLFNGEDSDSHGMWLSTDSRNDGRKHAILGCIRRSSAALAVLVAAAEVWVQGNSEWASVLGSFLVRPALHRKWFCETPRLTGDVGEGNMLGLDEALTGQRLADLGYEDAETDSLLVYAVIVHVQGN